MSQPPFVLETSWQCLDADGIDQVCAFWQREHAGLEGEAARKRAGQVLTRATNQDGQLIAVSTAVPCTIPRLLQPMYYYRCFVGAQWRGIGVAITMLRHGFDTLEQWATPRGFPCIGVLLELENTSLAGSLRRAYWGRVGFSYIGRSARGLDLRVRYFQDAELKPAP